MSKDFESRLHLLLDEKAQVAPPEPTLVDVLEQCEQDLGRYRRRVAAIAVGSAAAGLALAAVVSTLNGGGTGGADDDLVADRTDVDNVALIEACRNGTQPQHWTHLLFGGGAPRLVAYSAATEQTSTIMISGDGAYWADCLNADGAMPDAAASMTVYATESSPPPAYSAGLACDDGTTPDSECTRFIVDYVDRLPAVVDRVQFETADGVESVAPTDDEGFVIFDYAGTAPTEYRNPESRLRWITQISYLNAQGDLLAAERFDRHGPQPVAGTPSLTKYPSLSRVVMEDRGAS